MTWNGTFLRNSSDFFRAIEGYFFVQTPTGGFTRPITVVVETAERMVFRDFGNLGELTITGQNLTMTRTDLPLNNLSFPQLTGGTISNFSVRFNVELDTLTAARAAATTLQQQQAIDQQISNVNAATMAQLAAEAAGQVPSQSFLIPNSTVNVPNISAAQLGNAAVQSFQTGNAQPMRDFFNQFDVNFSGTGAPGGLLGQGWDLIGFDNADRLNGGPGNDRIAGNGGNDVLNGGGSGADSYDGGEGSDLYILGAGPDIITDLGVQGGLDIVSYQNAPGGVEMRLDQQATAPGTGWAQNDTFRGIEGVIGSRFGDTIIGKGGAFGPISADVLSGGGGNDWLIGQEGPDSLEGGEGDDRLEGGNNFDQLGNPGPGDVAIYAAGLQDVHFFLVQEGLQVVTPREGIDLLIGMELINLGGNIRPIFPFTDPPITFSAANRVFGGDQSVVATGGNGVDLMFGRGGDDVLRAFGANDIVDGGTGNDSIEGGDGVDTISGRDGDDDITGGAQADILFGDGGMDEFFGALEELNGDTYADLQVGETIRVQNASFSSGNVTFDQQNNSVQIDTDGNGTPEATFSVFGALGAGFCVKQDGADTVLKVLEYTFSGRPTQATGSAPSDMGPIRDFDGNDLGNAGDWKLIGAADVQFDGDVEYIYINQQIARWATVGPDGSGNVDFGNHGAGGDTRVVGIYIDPEVENGNVQRFSDFDSQQRFQNDLAIDNLTVIDAFDFDCDGFQEVYFKVNDGTAYLRALMHADGNIQYANYQNAQQVQDYLTGQGFGQDVLDTILI